MFFDLAGLAPLVNEHGSVPMAKQESLSFFARVTPLSILCLMSAIPRRTGTTTGAPPPPPRQAAGASTARDEPAPPSRRPLACYRSSCAYPPTLPPFPSDSLPGTLRVRGGGPKVAPKRTSGTGGGSDAASKPILGPITRRKAADSAGEQGEGGKEDGQQEFAPQFLDFESRVGFMKKVCCSIGATRDRLSDYGPRTCRTCCFSATCTYLSGRC